MNPQEIARLIETGMPGVDVRVASDDNTHFEAIIVSDAFAGQRPIARHQMVYQCLGSLMGNEIHALSIRAHTPDEWRKLTSTGQS
jgi:acid stress-induced BolA-like protein IbaG/YrbA